MTSRCNKARSLYPALYRLEKDGWIAGRWAATETGRQAKFYSLTSSGRAHLQREVAAWERVVSQFNLLVSGTSAVDHRTPLPDPACAAPVLARLPVSPPTPYPARYP